MKSKQKNPMADFTGGLPCYVCGVIDADMPAFAAYPVCSRCTKLSPVELIALPPDQRNRYGLALALNHVPDLTKLFSQSVSSTVSTLLAGRPRKKRRGSSR